MSDSDSNTGFERSNLFRSKAFLVGLVVGLSLCSAVARYVSHRGYHDVFTRFHIYISPDGQYYPTLEEMCSVVRTRCRPDQVLVIVGGNSIFHGVGQPADKLWTGELQRQLGDGFAVVNLAFRGAFCTDGAAVVAEVLRKEFPRQIYVANAGPFAMPEPVGSGPYRYLIWEARSRGLLESFAPREEIIDDFRSQDYTRGQRFELWALDRLDNALRFRDLWNWVGFRYIFTIQNPYTPHFPSALWPRDRFADNEDDFEAVPFSSRFRPEYQDAEMKIVRGFSSDFYLKTRNGAWHIKPGFLREFNRVVKGAIPDDLKARTLIMLSRNCPLYVRQLDSSERIRDDDAYRDCIQSWRAAGCEASDYGRDYDDTDFGDRTHLTATGGRMLAQQVASEVQGMAINLGYTTGGPSKP
jgi:hypothetical protein